MFWNFIPLPFLRKKKKKTGAGKILLIITAIAAGIAAVAYAAVKLYRKFCVIDNVDKDAIDDNDFLTEDTDDTQKDNSDSDSTTDN